MSVKCATQVHKSEGNWSRSYGCMRAAGHGPDKKYCAQHAEKFADGETTTWYAADCWHQYSCRVTAVQVLKETDNTLLVKGEHGARRESKASDSARYFRTLAEAVEFYQARLTKMRADADAFEAKIKGLKVEREEG